MCRECILTDCDGVHCACPCHKDEFGDVVPEEEMEFDDDADIEDIGK